MVAVFVLVLFAVLLLPVAYLAHRGSLRSGISRNGRPSWFVLALAGSAPFLLFLLMLDAGPHAFELVIPLLILAVVGMLLMLWVRELITLMGMGDEAFPGRYDKVLWFALLVLMPPVGVVTFALFRRVYWSANKPTTAPSHELI